MAGLSLRGVTVLRGARIAAEDVSFSAQHGAITAILGPSGSGKTSVLAAAAGLLPLERGAVFANDVDVTKLAAKKRGVALFEPGSELPESRKLAVALKGVAGRHGNAEAEAALSLPGLEGLGDRPVGQLSHGEGLLALAAARIAGARPQPECVLLVDEAGSGLDDAGLHAWWALLRARAQAGQTVVVASRDPHVALLADHLVLLHAGQVIQTGTPASVYAEPRDTRAARLSGGANILRGKVRELRPGGFLWSGGGRFAQAVDAEMVRPSLGTSFLLCLRPERIVFLRDGETAPNVLEARVEDVRSAGPMLASRLTSAAGPLEVLSPSWQPGVYPVAGQVLRIGWEADAGTVLADELA